MTQWKKECNDFINSHIEGTDILDIGSGAYPSEKATITLDVMPEITVRGRTARPDVVADVNEHIPLPDNSVDCIIMNNTLEHLHTPERAVDECHRILRQGGVLLVTVPFLVKIHQEPVDFHRYTIYMLQRLLKNFSDFTIEPVGSLTDIYKETQSSLFGMIGRRRTIAYVASRFIQALTSFLPNMYEESYVSGYLIKARK
jgi:SAM-dependent methyltransferase